MKKKIKIKRKDTNCKYINNCGFYEIKKYMPTKEAELFLPKIIKNKTKLSLDKRERETLESRRDRQR